MPLEFIMPPSVSQSLIVVTLIHSGKIYDWTLRTSTLRNPCRFYSSLSMRCAVSPVIGSELKKIGVPSVQQRSEAPLDPPQSVDSMEMDTL